MENNGKLHELGLKIADKVQNIIVVSTIGQDNGKKYTLSTLDSLGLLTTKNIINKKIVIFYDASNVVRDELYSKRCTQISCGGKKHFDVTLNWYYALKAALTLFDEAAANDKKYIMFLENDCVITKTIESDGLKLLDSVPKDADFINFNAVQAWVGPGTEQVKNNKKAFFNQLYATSFQNKEYAEITGTCRSFNCVMMTRRFCEKLATMIEERLATPNVQYIIDEYQTKSFFPDMKMYMSRQPLMVQYDDSKPKHTECFLTYYGLSRNDCVIPHSDQSESAFIEESMHAIGRKLEQMFDKIVIISMIRHEKPRCQTLNILDSMGVLSQQNIKSQKVIIQYDRPNMMRRVYCKNLQEIKNSKLECAYIFLNHYMAIADAYFGGAGSALFLEDDCILPKDTGRILEMLDGIPKGYDYINFNATIRHNMQNTDVRDFMKQAHADSIDENYARMKTPVVNGCCYAMSRDHMRNVVNQLEHILGLKKITEVDQILNDPAAFPNSKMYLTKFPLMSQIYDDQCKSHTSKDIYDKYYLSYDMTLDDFMTDKTKSAQCEYQEEQIKPIIVQDVNCCQHFQELENISDLSYSCVVCIDDQKFKLFQKTFDHYGLSVKTRIGKKIEGQTPVQNCSYNHICCVKYAKEHNWPYVLIFEDDAFPRTDIKKQLEDISSRFNDLYLKNDVDLLYLAGYCRTGKEIENPYFKKCNKQFSSHAYIVFSKFYDDFILNAQNKVFSKAIDCIFTCTNNAYYYNVCLFDQYTYKNTNKIHRTSLSKNNCGNFIGNIQPHWARSFDMKAFDDSWLKPAVIVFNYFINEKYSFTQNIIDWYNSMKANYLVDCNRKFVIYTDNKEAIEKLKNDDILFVHIDDNSYSGNNRFAENKLRKFKIIDDYLNTFNDEFDYLAFIQSNARCNAKIYIDDVIKNENDLTVFKHCSFNGNNFNRLYGNNEKSIVDVSKLNTAKFTYVHTGHFLCKKEVLKSICNFVNQSAEADKQNNICAKWHDETYFNFYLNTKLQNCANVSLQILDGKEYCKGFWVKGYHADKIKMLDKRLIQNKHDQIEKNKDNDIVLFACSEINDESMRRAQMIYDAATQTGHNFYWIYAQPEDVAKIPWHFNAIIYYKDMQCSSIDGNSNRDISILNYMLTAFKSTKNFWFIEYDVVFLGDWKKLFQNFDNKDADLITKKISQCTPSTNWYWRKYINEADLANGKAWTSLNCIFRISRAGIQSVLKYVSSYKPKIHTEFAIPSACMNDGLKTLAFGNWMSPSFAWQQYNLLSANTPNQLYHAIKLDAKVPDFGKKYFFKLCLSSHNVQNAFKWTLDTIMNQSFADFALVICVDSSSDKTFSTAKEYYEKYNNVYLIKLAGENALKAKDIAVDYPINAEFTVFIDSGDQLNDVNALKKMHDKIIQDS